MEFHSRNFKEGDYEKYIKLLTKENMEQFFIDNFGGWSDSVSKKKLYQVLKIGFVELFFLDDIFIGYVSFNSETNNKNSILINDIHIIKKYQQQGFGTKILNFVINKSIELNHTQLKVFVFKNNPSINFYKNNNFTECKYLAKSNTSILVKKL